MKLNLTFVLLSLASLATSCFATRIGETDARVLVEEETLDSAPAATDQEDRDLTSSTTWRRIKTYNKDSGYYECWYLDYDNYIHTDSSCGSDDRYYWTYYQGKIYNKEKGYNKWVAYEGYGKKWLYLTSNVHAYWNYICGYFVDQNNNDYCIDLYRSYDDYLHAKYCDYGEKDQEHAVHGGWWW